MANDLELHIGTTADSSGLKSAADELDKTKRSSDETGKSFHETGMESHELDEALAKMRESSEKAGTSFQDQARGAHNLDDELAKLRAQLKGLESQYAATGDRSLFKGIRSDRSLISALERIKKDLKDVEDEGGKANKTTSLLASTATSAISALVELGGTFTKSVGSAFSGVGDAVGPLKYGLIAGAVTAAAEVGPLIVGAIGGAITTAVGAGGIAVGLIGAARDPAVKAAISVFGSELSDEFTAIGKPFVRPFQDALAILSQDVKSLRLSDVFADAAPAVTGLAHAVGDFAKNIMPGFDKALQRSPAYMEQLDQSLSLLGASVGGFLDDVSASPGDLQALRQALDVTSATIGVLGKVVAEAGTAWHDLNAAWAAWYHIVAAVTPGKLGDVLEDLANRLDDYGKIGDHAIATTDLFGATVGPAATQTGVLAHSLDMAAIAAQRYSVALEGAATSDDALAKRHALNQAILAEKQGWIDLSRALDHAQGLNLKEQQSIESQAEVLERERQAAIAAGDGSVAAQDKAIQAYDRGIEKLLAMAKAAGATPAELAKLRSDYYITIHESVDRRVHEASDTRQFLGSAPAQHRAGGGSVLADMPYDINERAGKEVYFPAAGRVAPASMSPAGGQIVVRPLTIAGGGAAAMFLEWIRTEVQGRGGHPGVLGIITIPAGIVQ